MITYRDYLTQPCIATAVNARVNLTADCRSLACSARSIPDRQVSEIIVERLRNGSAPSPSHFQSHQSREGVSTTVVERLSHSTAVEIIEKALHY